MQVTTQMATTTNLGEVIKAAKPELALVLQQVAQRPPTQREREAITQFLSLPPKQQNAVVTTHIQHMAHLGRQGKLAATNPTVRHLGQFLFYDDTKVRAARAAPKQNDSRPATRERGNNAPTVRPTPTSEQSRRSNNDNNKNVIVRALHRLAQQRRKGDATVTTSGQWRNVPQYWAKKRERLRHRPAKAKTAAVRAHRRRIIRDTNSSLPSTALPRRHRTVRFTDGPTAQQVFQISQPATSIMSRSSGVAILPPVQQRVSILRSTKGDLTLTAAERRIIDEDTWRPMQ